MEAAYTHIDGTPFQPGEHPCSLCLREGYEGAAAGSRATGRRYDEGLERYVVFNGYVCDMHAEDIESLRWR
jgi:hypothetical protein